MHVIFPAQRGNIRKENIIGFFKLACFVIIIIVIATRIVIVIVSAIVDGSAGGHTRSAIANVRGGICICALYL